MDFDQVSGSINTFSNFIFYFWRILYYLITLIPIILFFILQLLWITAQTGYRIVTSAPGQLFIASGILVLLGLAISENQPIIMQEIDKVWCELFPIRSEFSQFCIEVKEILSDIVCVWNLFWLYLTELIYAPIRVFYSCGSVQKFLIDISNIFHSILFTLTEYLSAPLTNSFKFRTIWIRIQELILFIQIDLNCVCSSLSTFFQLILDIVKSDQLGRVIDTGIDSILSIFQWFISLLLGTDSDDIFFRFVTSFTNYLTSVGKFLDFVITRILKLFGEDIIFRILEGVSRIVAFGIKFIYALLNSFIEIVIGLIEEEKIDFDEFIDNLILAKIELINSAVAFKETFDQIDECLGETIYHIFEVFIQIFDEYIDFIGTEEFNLDNIYKKVVILIGNTRWFPDETHFSLSDSHIHNHPREQTGLTCLLSKIISIFLLDENCSKSISDLINTVLNYFLFPFEMYDVIINLEANAGFDFTGNPLNDDNRGGFNEHLKEILEIPINRILLLFDSAGHVLECFFLTEPIGNLVVDLTFFVEFELIKLLDLIILLGEIVFQLIIWVLSAIGYDPFGEGFIAETGTWFELFGIFLFKATEFIIQIFEVLINSIFFFFPAIFGQNTFLAPQNPGKATLSNCLSNLEDCSCGIVKEVATVLCLPFGIGCLSKLFPSCGDFDKKRSTNFYNYNNSNYTENEYLSELNFYTPSEDITIFDYLKQTFDQGACGDIFNDFRRDNFENKSDLEKFEFITCIRLIVENLKLASQQFKNETYYYIDGDYKDVILTVDNIKKISNQVNSGINKLNTAHLTKIIRDIKSDYNGKYNDSKVFTNNTNQNDNDNNNIFNYDDSNIIQNPLAIKFLNNINNTYTILENLDLKSELLYRLKNKENLNQTTILQKKILNYLRNNDSGILNFMGKSFELLKGSYYVSSSIISDFFELSFNDRILYTLKDLNEKIRSNKNVKKRENYEDFSSLTENEIIEKKLEILKNSSHLTRSLKDGKILFEMNEYEKMKDQLTIIFNLMYYYKEILLNPDGNNLEISNKIEVLESLSKKINNVKRSEFGNFLENLESYKSYLKDQNILKESFYTTIHYNCSKDFTGWGNTLDCSEVRQIKNTNECFNFFGVSVRSFCNSNSQALKIYSDNQCKKLDGALSSTGKDIECIEFSNSNSFLCINGFECAPEKDVFGLPDLTCKVVDDFLAVVTEPTIDCLEQLGLINTTIFGNDTIETRLNLTFPTNRTLTAPPELVRECGNLIIEEGEECDDGNTINGDGCDRVCKFERCGNGQVQPGEDCDLGFSDSGLVGKNVNGSGCSPQCKFEAGCGDGILDEDGPIKEQCDDGNRINGDGCDSKCQLEKCPGVIYNENVGPSGVLSCDESKLEVLRTPTSVINFGQTHSISINCFANPPVVHIHEETDARGQIIKTIFITDECPNQEGVCLTDLSDNPTGDPAGCENFLTLGINLTCGRNCSVCGDSIVDINLGEECDNGNDFEDESCIQCNLACDCSNNTGLPCFGTCIGGFNSGLDCNARLANTDIAPPINITYTADFFNNRVLTFESAVIDFLMRLCPPDECFSLPPPAPSTTSPVAANGGNIGQPSSRWTAIKSGDDDFVFLKNVEAIFGFSAFLTFRLEGEGFTECINTATAELFDDINNPNLPDLPDRFKWLIQDNEDGFSTIQNKLKNEDAEIFLTIDQSNNPDNIVCVDEVDGTFIKSTWKINLSGKGQECPDGGGICISDSCCGDGITQDNPKLIKNHLNEDFTYVEAGGCDSTEPFSDCFFCTNVIGFCECETNTFPVNAVNQTFLPCVGSCFGGSLNGQLCLSFPNNSIDIQNNFGVNENFLENLGINLECSFTLPDGINDDGVCVPTSCCGGGETATLISKICDDSFEPYGLIGISCPPLDIIERCEWECGLLGCVEPFNVQKKRSFDTFYNEIFNSSNINKINNIDKRGNNDNNDNNDNNKNLISYDEIHGQKYKQIKKNNNLSSKFKKFFNSYGGYYIGIDFVNSLRGVDNFAQNNLTDSNTIKSDQFLDDVFQFFFEILNSTLNLPGTNSTITEIVTFVFVCQYENVTCQGGIGAFDGFIEALVITLSVVFLLGFLFGSCSTVFTTAFTVFGFLLLFFAISWNYSPACFPRIPTCLIDEDLEDFCLFLNQNFINWTDELVIKPDGTTLTNCSLSINYNITCDSCEDRSFRSCEDFGFTDGVDNLLFFLSVQIPSVFDIINERSGILYFTLSLLDDDLDDRLDRFDYGDEVPPDIDQTCFFWTFFNIFQVITALFTIFYGSLILFSPVSFLIVNLYNKILNDIQSSDIISLKKFKDKTIKIGSNIFYLKNITSNILAYFKNTNINNQNLEKIKKKK